MARYVPTEPAPPVRACRQGGPRSGRRPGDRAARPPALDVRWPRPHAQASDRDPIAAHLRARGRPDSPGWRPGHERPRCRSQRRSSRTAVTRCPTTDRARVAEATVASISATASRSDPDRLEDGAGSCNPLESDRRGQRSGDRSDARATPSGAASDGEGDDGAIEARRERVGVELRPIMKADPNDPVLTRRIGIVERQRSQSWHPVDDRFARTGSAIGGAREEPTFITAAAWVDLHVHCSYRVCARNAVRQACPSTIGLDEP